MEAEALFSGLMLKVLGSVAGTALALVFKWPRNRRDFQQRAAFSILAGIFLTPVAFLIMRKAFDVPDNAETIVAMATSTAFVSWWAAIVFLRRVSSWTWKDDEKP